MLTAQSYWLIMSVDLSTNYGANVLLSYTHDRATGGTGQELQEYDRLI